MNANQLAEIVDAHRDGRQSTHWDGCHLAHPGCAVQVLADEVERLNGRVATLEGGIESFLSTGWYDATVGVHPRNVLRALLDASHDQEGNHEQ